MFEIIAHEDAGHELAQLPDELRGRMFRLVKKLEKEGPQLRMPHSKVISGGLFELRVGDKDISRCLYAFAIGKKVYLLHAFIKKTAKTPVSAITMARKRLKELQNDQNN